MKARDLDRRQNATHDERRRHQIALLVAREIGSVGEDNRRRNDTCQHGERVLKAQEQGEKNGHFVVQAEEWCCAALLFHKGEVGLEEKGIVV